MQSGINIVLKALEAPIRQIAENAGVEGSIVVGHMLGDKSQTFGFDAQTEQYVDMLSAGILDPAKVVRIALQDAASIAGLMITTEAMVAEQPKKNAPARCRAAADGRHGRDGLLKPANPLTKIAAREIRAPFLLALSTCCSRPIFQSAASTPPITMTNPAKYIPAHFMMRLLRPFPIL